MYNGYEGRMNEGLGITPRPSLAWTVERVVYLAVRKTAYGGSIPPPSSKRKEFYETDL